MLFYLIMPPKVYIYKYVPGFKEDFSGFSTK